MNGRPATVTVGDLDTLPAKMTMGETCAALRISVAYGFRLRQQRRWPLPKTAEIRDGRLLWFRGAIVAAYLRADLRRSA